MGASQVGTTYGTRFRFEGTGCYIYSGVGDPEGVQVGSVGDWYQRADCSATNPPIYAKLSGTNTTTGWVAIGGAGAAAAHTFTPLSAVLALVGNMNTKDPGVLQIVGNQPTMRVDMQIAPSSATLTVTGGTVPEWT